MGCQAGVFCFREAQERSELLRLFFRWAYARGFASLVFFRAACASGSPFGEDLVLVPDCSGHGLAICRVFFFHFVNDCSWGVVGCDVSIPEGEVAAVAVCAEKGEAGVVKMGAVGGGRGDSYVAVLKAISIVFQFKVLGIGVSDHHERGRHFDLESVEEIVLVAGGVGTRGQGGEVGLEAA